MIFTLGYLADNEAFATNEVVLEYDNINDIIFISWDIETDLKCYMRTAGEINQESFDYLGADMNNLSTTGGLLIEKEDFINALIPCKGKLTQTFSDYSTDEINSLSIFTQINLMTDITNQKLEKNSYFTFLYKSDKMPFAFPCGNAWHTSPNWIEMVTDKTTNIKSKTIDKICIYSLDTSTIFPNLSSKIIHKTITPTTILISNSNPSSETKKDQSGDNCNDCEAPTLGSNKDFKHIVDYGFSFNDIPIQVIPWHTPYPLINATVGEINKMEIKFTENNGLANMKSLQIGLGLPELGDSLEDAEVLIIIPFLTNGTLTGITLDEINIIDPDNLIHPIATTVKAVPCQESNPTSICGKLDLYYSYREAPLHHMVVIEVTDKNNNFQRFHFNDGINVLGDSLNPPNTLFTFGKLFTQIDKVNDIWTDENNIQYKKNSFDSMFRITPDEPYVCNDPPLAEIMNGGTRTNCNFRAQLAMWNQ